jgi:hypothetical protein
LSDTVLLKVAKADEDELTKPAQQSIGQIEVKFKMVRGRGAYAYNLLAGQKYRRAF